MKHKCLQIFYIIFFALCILPVKLLAQSEISLTERFPGQQFEAPVDLTFAPDAGKRLFIVEKAGKILSIDTSKTPNVITTFLDISGKVNNKGSEEGLLGLAFSPRFKENGEFFVYYCAEKPKRTLVSRFRVNKTSGVPDAASELVIIEVPQPYSNHNGGQIVFGPDGYLYIGLGDGGSGGDPHGHGQNLGTLLGALLRIDVSESSTETPYKIPADNPFVSNPAVRPEIYAYGLRNPWRFSFDASTGELWLADVGQNKYEEVNIISKGGNYGWNILEGSHCFKPPVACMTTGLAMPIHEYDHSLGQSITGGFVYRGKELPFLIGQYIFADFASGKLWALRRQNTGKSDVREILDSNVLISSFGVDWDNELYVVGYQGKVYKVQTKN